MRSHLGVTVVRTQGDDGGSLMFLESGRLEVSTSRGTTSTLREGTAFGEMGILFTEDCNATITASADSIVLDLDAKGLQGCLQDYLDETGKGESDAIAAIVDRDDVIPQAIGRCL
jgi:CRP-like cAMP-binding protein